MTRAKNIMIQGTASNSGKSFLVAGLCRIFRQDGYSVAPFKSQNMALNSFITADGLEMGRAQAAQAEAAGVEADVRMNPILLKPTGEAKSQVIVNGKATTDMNASEYYARKDEFVPIITEAYRSLAASHDVVVLEGAGCPAEINLYDNDIVNMGMAALADAPVLLVGDIDRGGVFASLYGVVSLVRDDDRDRIKGMIVNKFRGDLGILRPGLRRLEELTGKPVLGVAPWLNVDLDDEDSLSPRLANRAHAKAIDVLAVRFPRLSNFTDFAAVERHPLFGVRYVDNVRAFGSPDLVVLPGSENAMADLAWMRQNGLEAAIKKFAAAGGPVIGICGGCRMLGVELADSDSAVQPGGMRGMELLPVRTTFRRTETRKRVQGTVDRLDGYFARLSGAEFEGYEIHTGDSTVVGQAQSFSTPHGGVVRDRTLGVHVHGLFDDRDILSRLARILLAGKDAAEAAIVPPDHRQYKERQYDLLADALRKALDMDAIRRILNRNA